MSTAGPDVRPGLVLAVVSAGVFLASLDLFIVNIAFPDMARAFDATPASLSWVLNAYTLGFAALLLPAGRTADRIGRRRVFLAGMVLFTLASAGCAAAWDVPSLVAFRAVQSVGAAMVMATSLALLLHSFPPARRSSAIAVWAAMGGVAAALGPPVGGLLVEASWRWVFLVNAPVGVVALLVGLRVLPESRDAGETRRPDLLGTALLVTGVAVLAWALVEAPDLGWSDGTTVTRLVVAALALAAAVLRAAQAPRRLVPVLPLALFRSRPFTLACLAGAAFFAAFGAMLLGNVLWLTEGWGLSTLRAGIYLVPGPFLAAVVAVPAGRLGARYGCGQVAVLGTALFSLGALWWLWQIGPEQEYVVAFLPGQVLAGIGVGLTITNLVDAAAGRVRHGHGHLQRGTSDRRDAGRRAAARRRARRGRRAGAGPQRLGAGRGARCSGRCCRGGRRPGAAPRPRGRLAVTALGLPLARVLAQRPLPQGGDGAGRTEAVVDRSWWSWSGPHGGLLAALALGAAQGVVAEDLVPQVVSAQYLSAAGDAPLELAARVLRAGGSSDVVRVDVASEGEAVLSAAVTLARPRPGGTRWGDVMAPAAPPPFDCLRIDPSGLVPFAQHVEIRKVGPGPFEDGVRPELLAWVRWVDADVVVDAASLLVLVDALAPALYAIAAVPVAVPTVDLTVTLQPEPPHRGWMLVRIRTRTAADGWCVDDSEVWAPDGRLLAQARQTRRVLGDLRPSSAVSRTA